MRILQVTFFLCIIPAGVARCPAAEWVSSDGTVSVEMPEIRGLSQIEPPPQPFLVLWSNRDETIRMGVTESAIPPNIELSRSSAEQGFADLIGGTITASSSIVKNGHEVWIMTAESSNPRVRYTQALVTANGYAYKAMAAKIGDAPIDGSTMDAFVASIVIGDESAAPRGPVRSQGSKGRAPAVDRAYRFGVIVGELMGIAVFLGLLWIVVGVIRRR